MKLSYKRTILVGFAFFLISAFWQAYDATIPVILTNKFGMSQTWSGVIMALDNILAVFMLPIFGTLSDKCLGNKYGKRTPFITIGTIVAAVALLGLAFVDNAQLQNISDVSKIDDPAALEVIYDSQASKELMTPTARNSSSPTYSPRMNLSPSPARSPTPRTGKRRSPTPTTPTMSPPPARPTPRSAPPPIPRR